MQLLAALCLVSLTHAAAAGEQPFETPLAHATCTLHDNACLMGFCMQWIMGAFNRSVASHKMQLSHINYSWCTCRHSVHAGRQEHNMLPRCYC